MNVSVCPVPAALTRDQLLGAAVVIDALRMTSVAIRALSSGCPALRPVEALDEARALARECGAALGGERDALRIEGFDFSNSPLEYSREAIAGRPVVITTSNGTHALLCARRAPRVLLGAYLNASAVARAVSRERELCFVCAGTHGRFSLEDAVAAGAIIDRLPPEGRALDDMALAAHRLYLAAKGDLRTYLSPLAHVRRLEAIGYAADVEYCLHEDACACVPCLDADGWIRRSAV